MIRRWPVALALAGALAACATPTPTPTPTPEATPTAEVSAKATLEAGELTRALLFDGEPLDICMPHVRDFAERVVGEAGWSTEKRLRAGAYVEWFEEHC